MIRHRDLATRLRWEITEECRYPPGHPLPNHRELAELFSTTKTTVARALDVLAAEGLIEVIHGKGTFVTGGTSKQTSKSATVEHQLRLLAGQRGAQRIPGAEQVAVRYSVSSATARRVLRKLTTQGVLIRRRDGTYEPA